MGGPTAEDVLAVPPIRYVDRNDYLLPVTVLLVVQDTYKGATLLLTGSLRIYVNELSLRIEAVWNQPYFDHFNYRRETTEEPDATVKLKWRRERTSTRLRVVTRPRPALL